MMLAPGWRKMIDQHGRLAVGVAGVAQVFDGIHHVAHVGDAYGGAVVVGDEQRLVIDGVENLVVGAHLPHLMAVGEMPLGSVGVGAWRWPADLLQADAVLVQSGGIQLDADAGKRAPAHHHLPHALHLRQLLRHDGGGGVVHLALAQHVRGEREHEDGRIGRIHLAVGGIAGQVGRQVAAGGIDGRLHVARRRVDIAVQIELQRDAGRPPSVLEDVISVTAAMRPNWRSSGVATEEAMVSGLAPGKTGAHRNGREVHQHGWAIVVATEGIRNPDGSLVYELKDATHLDPLARPMTGGVGQFMANLVGEKLKMRCRTEKPGLIARAADDAGFSTGPEGRRAGWPRGSARAGCR